MSLDTTATALVVVVDPAHRADVAEVLNDTRVVVVDAGAVSDGAVADPL
jgi:hypothetical protein